MAKKAPAQAEHTVESLLAENEELKNQLAEVQAAFRDVNGICNKYVDELTEAKAKIVELSASNGVEELQAQLAEALAAVEELGNKLSLVEAHKAENVNIVTVGKKNYKLLGNRFIANGEELNAEQLMQNEAELQRLVDIGSGSLVEVD